MPKKAASSRTARTPKKEAWKDRFIARLTESPNVTAACAAAGIGRTAAYEHREKDAEFAQRWEEAIEAAVDVLEDVARERALTISDTLLIFLLKSHRPDVYRENLAPLVKKGRDRAKAGSRTVRIVRGK